MSAEILLVLISLLPTAIVIPRDAVDLALGPMGSIMCLRPASPELIILSADGTEIASWDLEGLLLPVALAARPDGSFLVCDASSGDALLFNHRAELIEEIVLPSGTITIAQSGAEVWCFSSDEEAVCSVLPASGHIASSQGFRPADLSMDSRRAILSSRAGSFLVEPGSSSTWISTGPACLAGGSIHVVRGDSLFDVGRDALLAVDAGGFDRIEGSSDGRILLWRSGSTDAVLLE